VSGPARTHAVVVLVRVLAPDLRVDRHRRVPGRRVGFAGHRLNRGGRAAFIMLAMPAFAPAWFTVGLPGQRSGAGLRMAGSGRIVCHRHL